MALCAPGRRAGLRLRPALRVLGSLLMPRESASRPASDPAHQKRCTGSALAFATYGVTVLPPHGNGFIAVFVAAIVLGMRRPDLRAHFAQRADEIVEIVKLGDLRRVRLAARPARLFSRRLGGGRVVAGDVPAGAAGRDLDRARREPR